MADESFTSHVRLKPAERSKLLCRLDEAPSRVVGRDRRRYKRWDFRLSDIAVLVQHPGGGVGRYLVCARNISAGGLSFIHGGYLHPGSECRVLLPRRDGNPVAVNGVVVHCRHVESSYHEVGLRFTQEVDPTTLLDDSAAEPDDAGRKAELPQIDGRVLVVDPSKADRVLMTHQLATTGLSMTMVDSPGAAIDALRRGGYQLVLCDLHLEKDAVHMIEQMRKIGFKSPIIVITAENSPARLVAARRAGANEIIGKPYNPNYLVSLLAEWLEAPRTDQPVFSSLEDSPGMAELIVDYISAAHRKAQQIEEALGGSDDRAGLRDLCLDLLGSGAGYGFEAVTEAARDALTALDTGKEPKDVEPPLKRLAGICHRLRCGSSVRPAGKA